MEAKLEIQAQERAFPKYDRYSKSGYKLGYYLMVSDQRAQPTQILATLTYKNLIVYMK